MRDKERKTVRHLNRNKEKKKERKKERKKKRKEGRKTKKSKKDRVDTTVTSGRSRADRESVEKAMRRVL